MSTRKVEAIVRFSALEGVEDALKEAGINGLTVSPVRGFGEYRNFFRDDWTHRFARIEIFTTRAEEIANLIVEAAHTGAAGDGLVAIEPVDQVVRIRDRKTIENGEG